MKRQPKTRFPWRRINSRHWWCSDLGSATKLADGWYASGSSYQDRVLTPNVGPFSTALEAKLAWEDVHAQRCRDYQSRRSKA